MLTLFSSVLKWHISRPCRHSTDKIKFISGIYIIKIILCWHDHYVEYRIETLLTFLKFVILQLQTRRWWSNQIHFWTAELYLGWGWGDWSNKRIEYFLCTFFVLISIFFLSYYHEAFCFIQMKGRHDQYNSYVWVSVINCVSIAQQAKNRMLLHYCFRVWRKSKVTISQCVSQCQCCQWPPMISYI